MNIETLCLLAQNPIVSMLFCGWQRVVDSSIASLSKYNVDIVIVIPIKGGADVETVFKNLASVDLAGLKVGVILGLDIIVDVDWQIELNKKINQVSSRYEFVEQVRTTLPPRSMIDRFANNTAFVEMLEGLGMRDVRGHPMRFMVIREELRLIIKGLNCKFALWLDADELAPVDVISKLMRHADKADLVAGWAYDRHYPFEKVTFEAAKQYPPENDEEREYYEKANEFVGTMQHAIEFYANIIALQNGMNLPFNVDRNFYVIAPSRVMREKKPIETVFTGFGCILVKKEVNDRCSFMPELGASYSEDNTFCIDARNSGYKLVVDPTCYLEHNYQQRPPQGQLQAELVGS